MASRQSNIKLALLHHDLRGWAKAAKFEEVTSRNLGTADYFELRFKRGRNKECHTATEALKWGWDTFPGAWASKFLLVTAWLM
jgi:hypothetical protein